MTTNFADGEAYWVDVSAPDVPKTAEFYCELFGWEAQDLGEEAGHYTMLSLGGKTFGAVGPCMSADVTPSWMTYFKVADAHATTKAVEAAGGTVRVPPMDVFDQNTLAQYTDPAGAQFAVSQPRKHQGAEVWNVAGTPSWVELNVQNAEPSESFYRQVFGWSESTEKMEGGTYRMFSAAGQERNFAGLFELSAVEGLEHVPPHWLVYFEVADCDATYAKATSAGARAVTEPQTLPGVGRFGSLMDANGAVFAVITGESGS
ncbi:MAG TPA: VOC family protein [Stackebrandtia sp.]|jgi:predicted enzyme related to lactoylglutathione lyase|uniref:VOC family protein n=1 Tax=Stackebrandtia sp. TaxID=2023065 RepID=UPI002D57C3B2|nr:VOC family protein [Stackebrandtia sp.]HZE37565.1 VOC family protein [Stackebrandtia sp.]